MKLSTSQRGAISLHVALTVFLGLGMVLFGVLAVVAYRDNEFVRGNLDQLVEAARTKAAEDQKAVDAEENRKANQQPFRTYTADAVDGSFQVQIPKTWSLYAAKNLSAQTQLELAADPETVVQNRAATATNTHAVRVQLVKRSVQEVAKSYDEQLKKKDKPLISKAATVSGIPATRLEGELDKNRRQGAVVFFQLRDKTVILSCENPKYLPEFDQILATAKFVQ